VRYSLVNWISLVKTNSNKQNLIWLTDTTYLTI
jgi:hypothetical protein